MSSCFHLKRKKQFFRFWNKWRNSADDGLDFNGRTLPDITEDFAFYWIQWDRTSNVSDSNG